MIKATRTLIIAAAFSAIFAPFSTAETSVPTGSIRPSGKIAPADLPAAAKISFQAALTSALAAVPGSVIKAELEVEDGSLLYSFEIVGADRTITEVEVDAGNGKVLATEKENPKPVKREHPLSKEKKY